jgi:hypothetical protein
VSGLREEIEAITEKLDRHTHGWLHNEHDVKRQGGLGFFNQVCHRLADLRAALSKPPPSPWRPIAEAPRDGTRVLVWLPSWDEIIQTSWRDHGDDYQDVGWGTAEQPAHWMPLPAPPQTTPTTIHE